MNTKSKLRLFLGLLMLAILMLSIILYMDNDRSNLRAEQASLSTESYIVGIDYSGFIAESFIEVGQSVSSGDVLYHIESNMLLSRLQDDNIQRDELSYVINDANQAVIIATNSGVVSRINYTEGSFVAANSEIASITTNNKSVTATATFSISRRDFNQLQQIDVMEVTLPDGTRSSGRITNISFIEQSDMVVTEVQAQLQDVNILPFVSDGGTPVEARITLNESTLYERLVTNVRTLISRSSSRE